ncbi:hypothetical protein GP486_002909 [Trichoglossum hirsutum]|uniref:YTH domain-containing protein n=1 Tax=Trichoglossum hirsutum TaxID=265104 RepID=A0A9P8LDX3_9PEZI|nr:hypothetical protein GP486_002909 [Trichoglossum hirsutum]
MNNRRLSVPECLEEDSTRVKVESQPRLTNLGPLPTSTPAEQPSPGDRVRFDRRKRRPAAIITSPGFYVPRYIESGDPLMNDDKLRDISSPERVLVDHSRPKVPKLYFENSAPLLGSKENLPNEEARDSGMEPPHSAPSSSSDSWCQIPNVLLTPRCLRLTSSDLAERLGQHYPITPRSAGLNQSPFGFGDIPDSPTPGAVRTHCAKTMDDPFSYPKASLTDGGVATSTGCLLPINATDESSSAGAMPPKQNRPSSTTLELEVATNTMKFVRPPEGKGAVLKHIDNSFPTLDSYNTYRVGLLDMAVGGGFMAITGDSKRSNVGQNEHDAADLARIPESQQVITPKLTPLSGKTSVDTPDSTPSVSSSNATVVSPVVVRFPTRTSEGEVALTSDSMNTGLKVYGSMMDNTDLGAGSVNRGLNVGVISRPHAQQAQTQGKRQQLPQRPQGIVQPSISQAQQHHLQGNISVPSCGPYYPSTNQQGFDPLSSPLVTAYEFVRVNELRSLPAIRHSSFRMHGVPGWLPSSPLASSANGQFGVPSDTASLAHPSQPNHMTDSSCYPPQTPRHRFQVRGGRYGHGRHPGATNLTRGVAQIGPANLNDEKSDTMTWQEEHHPRSLDLLNLPGNSIPNAASLLSGLNPPSYSLDPGVTMIKACSEYCCFIIKSKSEDDVRASIIHKIWSSTEKGNQRLNEQYNNPERHGPFLLIFCVNGR